MNRIVTTAVLDEGPRRLATPPRDQYDPVVRDLVDRASADAYERGRRDGYDQGAAAVDRTREELVSTLATAADQAARTSREARDHVIGEAVELALAIATAILGREPHDGGAAVAAQVRETLSRVEDPAPVVRVHPDDASVVTMAVADLRSVTVEPDQSLAPGEARIRGGWADADLTRATAFAAIRKELGADE